MPIKPIEKLLQGLNILIVDSNPYMRRLTRTMLMNLGAKSVIEAADGLAALERSAPATPTSCCSIGTCRCSTAWR